MACLFQILNTVVRTGAKVEQAGPLFSTHRHFPRVRGGRHSLIGAGDVEQIYERLVGK